MKVLHAALAVGLIATLAGCADARAVAADEADERTTAQTVLPVRQDEIVLPPVVVVPDFPRRQDTPPADSPTPEAGEASLSDDPGDTNAVPPWWAK